MYSSQTEQLQQENQQYANTGGISQNNREEGFIPAFMDLQTGKVQLARYKNGAIAPFHMIDGLPSDWLHYENQKVAKLKQHIVSGFVRCDRFFNRSEAAEFMARIA